ncbi:hypothetical protein AX774_g8210, partial [Zancudomyces culisetae]
MREVDRF